MRIKTIVEMMDEADVLLDIGTDHGYVIIEALNNKKVKKAIGTDINQLPLSFAYKNIHEENLDQFVKLIQTDGFKNIDDYYDAVVITGLGFKTIEKIMMMEHREPKYYILGAQRQIEELRLFLSNNHFRIVDEEIVYEKKAYIFIKVVKGEQKLSEEDVILGPILKTKKAAKKHYEEKIKVLKKIKANDKKTQKNVKKTTIIYGRAINNLENKNF